MSSDYFYDSEGTKDMILCCRLNMQNKCLQDVLQIVANAANRRTKVEVLCSSQGLCFVGGNSEWHSVGTWIPGCSIRH